MFVNPETSQSFFSKDNLISTVGWGVTGSAITTLIYGTVHLGTMAAAWGFLPAVTYGGLIFSGGHLIHQILKPIGCENYHRQPEYKNDGIHTEFLSAILSLQLRAWVSLTLAFALSTLLFSHLGYAITVGGLVGLSILLLPGTFGAYLLIYSCDEGP